MNEIMKTYLQTAPIFINSRRLKYEAQQIETRS